MALYLQLLIVRNKSVRGGSTQYGTHADPGVSAPRVMRRVGRQRVASCLAVRAVLVRGQRGLRAPPAKQARWHAALVDGSRLPLQSCQFIGRRNTVLAVPPLGRRVRLGIATSSRRIHLCVYYNNHMYYNNDKDSYDNNSLITATNVHTPYHRRTYVFQFNTPGWGLGRE